MHNIEVGDIFATSNDLYKVVGIQETEEFPSDPYLTVETFVSGSGWKEERMSDGSLFGFTLFEAQRWGFDLYKKA